MEPAPAILPRKKVCRRCSARLPATTEFFAADSRNRDGLFGHCRECERFRMRLYSETEKHQAYRKEYDSGHREHINARAARYRADHQEETHRATLARAERNPAKLLVRGARLRSRRDGLPFDLTESFVEGLLGPTCPVLGLPYDFKLDGPLDLSPSLDRIDSSKPYVAGNVAVISYRANRIKNDGTAAEHRRVGESSWGSSLEPPCLRGRQNPRPRWTL